MKALTSNRRALLLKISAVVVAGLAVYVLLQLWNLPDVSLIEKYQPVKPIQIYDRDNHFITTIESGGHHSVLAPEDVPIQARDAILAAEDHNFFHHPGIDPLSTLRALLANIFAGKVVEGGSTITQQLAKNLYFEKGERTLSRKIKEAFLALELEAHYSKQQILQMYLSQVYFGNGAYGIEQAANEYFNVHAFELSLAQSAFLAGLVRAPTGLGKVENRYLAIDREHEILAKMADYGYVSKQAALSASKEKLVFAKTIVPYERYPYYISYVQQLLAEKFGKEGMWQSGLKVYTNLDPRAQSAAEQVLQSSIKRVPPGITEEALVSINVKDGAVVALVGGVGDYFKHQWNCAVNPHTTGSAFKPFVYLAAFNKRLLTPDSIIDDTPLTVNQNGKSYSPKDFDNKFLGPIKCSTAIALSRNVCAVRAAQIAGIAAVINVARLCGIAAKLDPDLSLALGSCAVSPLEMAGAYSTFARDGEYLEPQVIRRITDDRGSLLLAVTPHSIRSFRPAPVEQLVGCLQEVVVRGTGRAAQLSDRPVAGKTGTADKSKDIWFIGFTPDLVTAVWAGNDQDLPIAGANVTGGGIMAGVWRQYNQGYYASHPTNPGYFNAPTRTGGGILSGLKRLFAPPSSSPSREPSHHEGFWHKIKYWFKNL